MDTNPVARLVQQLKHVGLTSKELLDRKDRKDIAITFFTHYQISFHF
jgi:hypothetical protein